METDSNHRVVTSVEEEGTKGWTGLYLLVVGALAAQIAFFAWLTKAFE